MAEPLFNFGDPELVAQYLSKGPPAFAPGHAGMLQMTGVLLAERVPDDGAILIVGAGGGLETRYLAGLEKEWRVVGVDPAAAMLGLARLIAGPAAQDRLTLIEGTAADAPSGPFDGATCILVLGLIPDDGSKRATLNEMRKRLKPGAPFILVDQCIALEAPAARLLVDRYAAYALASGVDPGTVAIARQKVEAGASMVGPQRVEQLLADAGFKDSQVFYVGMSWRGWAAYA